MYEMTTRERFQRMFEHREADRVPMIGGPWGTTLERWRREGMPAEVSFSDYFGLDHVAGLGGVGNQRFNVARGGDGGLSAHPVVDPRLCAGGTGAGGDCQLAHR